MHTPHASAVLEGVGTSIEGAGEVAVDLVLALAALVDEGELEEGAHVGALARERHERGHVRGPVLGALPVRVHVHRPLVAPHRERPARQEPPRPHPLRQGEPLHRVPVRPAHRLEHRPRPRVAAIVVVLRELRHRKP